jgi:hypothetical protein
MRWPRRNHDKPRRLQRHQQNMLPWYITLANNGWCNSTDRSSPKRCRRGCHAAVGRLQELRPRDTRSRLCTRDQGVVSPVRQLFSGPAQKGPDRCTRGGRRQRRCGSFDRSRPIASRCWIASCRSGAQQIPELAGSARARLDFDPLSSAAITKALQHAVGRSASSDHCQLRVLRARKPCTAKCTRENNVVCALLELFCGG